MLSRTYLSPRRRECQQRKYHAYGLASKFLAILHVELQKKHEIVKIHKDSVVQKHMTIASFMKKTKTSPHLKTLDEVEKSLDACVNIKRLCDEAYELGKNIRENTVPQGYKISEELDEFICLTNEHTSVYSKEDYEKYRRMFKSY